MGETSGESSKGGSPGPPADHPGATWAGFEMAELLERQARSGRAFVEFLRVPSLSAEVYALPAGATDPQRPHAQDELYYVVRGRARFRAGGEDRPVGPGSVLYVRAGVEHRFHTVTEDLTVLVVFAPAFTGPAAG
jgi:mannose-6-phosphate isomerase-like protein (cupin superfamily)